MNGKVGQKKNRTTAWSLTQEFRCFKNLKWDKIKRIRQYRNIRKSIQKDRRVQDMTGKVRQKEDRQNSEVKRKENKEHQNLNSRKNLKWDKFKR